MLVFFSQRILNFVFDSQVFCFFQLPLKKIFLLAEIHNLFVSNTSVFFITIENAFVKALAEKVIGKWLRKVHSRYLVRDQMTPSCCFKTPYSEYRNRKVLLSGR